MSLRQCLWHKCQNPPRRLQSRDRRGSVACALVAATLLSCAKPPPRTVLWAWERPEDLRFLSPDEADIAILVNRIVLRGDQVEAHPRTQPVETPAGITVMPVVRIEADRPSLDDAQLEKLVASIRRTTRDSRFRGLQIDFDAAKSQRPFYRRLLERLRPDYRPLSMTALVSWCFEPSWLEGLPVDEIVPMVFRMGPDAQTWVKRMEREKGFSFRACNGSLGVATDELLRWVPPHNRLYLFHARPWSEGAYAEALGDFR